MFSAEKSRSEKPEEEKSPEKVVGNAVLAIENKDATDPVISSEWAQKAKTFGKISALSLGIPLALLFKAIIIPAFKFAKKAIEKKGNVGFGEGYKIGQEIFSFDNKKDKK